MKKALLSMAAVATLFTACKKSDDDNQTRSQMLVGTWNMSSYGMDANNNSTLDNGETGPTSTTTFGAKVTMNSDATGTQVAYFLGTADTSNFKWALTNNENSLQIIDGTDTSYMLIKSISSSNLTLLDTAAGMQFPLWEVFTK